MVAPSPVLMEVHIMNLVQEFTSSPQLNKKILVFKTECPLIVLYRISFQAHFVPSQYLLVVQKLYRVIMQELSSDRYYGVQLTFSH